MFLRFNSVWLYYHFCNSSQLSITEKCRAFVDFLRSIRKPLSDANSIKFIGAINQNDRADFTCHSQLLSHLQSELLPICGSARRYEFSIYFIQSQVDSIRTILSKIIQTQQISRCSNVQFYFDHFYQPFPLARVAMSVPVTIISNWIYRSQNSNHNGIKIDKDQNNRERFLRIRGYKIQNGMCGYLKKVQFYL